MCRVTVKKQLGMFVLLTCVWTAEAGTYLNSSKSNRGESLQSTTRSSKSNTSDRTNNTPIPAPTVRLESTPVMPPISPMGTGPKQR